MFSGCITAFQQFNDITKKFPYESDKHIQLWYGKHNTLVISTIVYLAPSISTHVRASISLSVVHVSIFLLLLSYPPPLTQPPPLSLSPFSIPLLLPPSKMGQILEGDVVLEEVGIRRILRCHHNM